MSSYKNKSIRELKKELKGWKAKKADTIEIKFVANLIRKKFSEDRRDTFRQRLP